MKKFFKENWKYMLIILVFAALCVTLTIFGIEKFTGTKITLRSNVNNNPEGIDLRGTYDMNDLHVKRTKYSYKDVDLDLLQIEGLKNKEVEDTINKEWKDIIDKDIDEGRDYVTMYVTGNFSNLLSIYIYTNKMDDEGIFEDEVMPRTYYLNYNLNDGSKILFSDLFTNDAPISLIVRNAMYDEKVKNSFWDNAYTYDESLGYEEAMKELHTKPLPVDDDLLTAEVVKFMNIPESEKCFAIYPDSIKLYNRQPLEWVRGYVDASDYLGEIRFVDNAEDIAVYSRFTLGSNLYKEKFAPRGVFTCADYSQDYMHEEIRGEVSKNLYIDFATSTPADIENEYYAIMGEENIEKYNKIFRDFVEDEVKGKVIKELKKDAERGRGDYYYISFLGLEASHLRLYQEEFAERYDYYAPSNVITLTLTNNTYKIPVKLYEETYHDRLIDTYRSSWFNFSADKRLLNDGDYTEFEEGNPYGIEFTSERTSRLFNFKTGEELTTLDDIFEDGAITEETLLDEFAMQLHDSWRELSDDRIVELISKGISYTLESDAIKITSNVDPDESVWLYYSEVDLPLLKIFDEDVKRELAEVRGVWYPPEGFYDDDGTVEPDNETSNTNSDLPPEWNDSEVTYGEREVDGEIVSGDPLKATNN